MRLAGKVALVTGGANGMGAAECALFVREGAQVVVADVLDDKGREVAAAFGDPARGCFEHLDVTVEADWQRAVAATVQRFGRLDILVNNAGITGGGEADVMDVAAWDRLLAVNATGVMLGMRHAVPAMKAAGGGAIVNISSVAAFGAIHGTHMGYSASKAATLMLARSAAIQYARDGIRVNSVHPGLMPLMLGWRPQPADPTARERRLERIPMGRRGRVEEVASAVLFLASDEASYITGAALVVDGGWSAALG